MIWVENMHRYIAVHLRIERADFREKATKWAPGYCDVRGPTQANNRNACLWANKHPPLKSYEKADLEKYYQNVASWAFLPS